MKYLIVFACTLALASAQYGQHHTVIGPHGVPLDTPAVQQATAAHFAYKSNIEAREDHVSPILTHTPVVAPVVAHTPLVVHPQVVAHPQVVPHTPVVAPVIGHTPVVAQAPLVAYPVQHGITPAGVPADTPEVAAAKVQHHVAHAEATGRSLYPAAFFYRAKRDAADYYAYSGYPTYHQGSEYSYTPYNHYYRARRDVGAYYPYSGYNYSPVYATSGYNYHY